MINISSLNKGLVAHFRLAADLQKVGSELHTDLNAANISSETNATTGFSSSGCTLTSDASIYEVGIYSIKGIFTGSVGRFYKDILTDWSLTAGHTYRIRFWARHIGSGGTIRISLGDGVLLNGVNIATLGSSDTTFVEYEYDFVAGASYAYFGAIEFSGTDDGGCYIDGLSCKPLLIADLTPYGNHPQNFGVTLDQADRKGLANGAGDFDGSGYLEYETLDLGLTDKWTVAWWMNMDSTALQTFFSFTSVAGTSKIEFITNNTTREIFANLLGGTGDPNQCKTDNDVWSLSTWTRVMVTYSGAGTLVDVVDFYIDGVPVTNNLQNGSTIIAQANIVRDLNIGRQRGGGREINGRLEEVKVWNRALSSAEAIVDANSYKSNLVVS